MSTTAIFNRTRSRTFGMAGLALVASLFSFAGCDDGVIEQSGEVDELRELGLQPDLSQTSCDPTMSMFPIAAPHNIGFDKASCTKGKCNLSCPDANSNSDWNMNLHHGNDIYADHGVPIVAVASGKIRGVGVSINKLGGRSTTSGIRVRLRDECGWEYYYGHLDEAVVVKGQTVEAGDLIGYMGSTGSSSTNLHFNISPDGLFSSDIDPFPLLTATSPTACDGDEPASQPPPLAGCVLDVEQALKVNQSITSCNGKYTLSMGLDGNLVLHDEGGVELWSTQTAGGTGQAVVMEDDGNLVMRDSYDGTGASVWEASTAGHPGATLRVEDDGNVRIYEGDLAIWSAL